MPKLLTRAWFKVFLLFDRIGVHIIPKHYYSPVPDYRWLETHREAWTGRASLTGIRWDLDEQLEWVAEICQPHYHEVAGVPFYEEAEAPFGQIEAQVVHCFTCKTAASRINEIGGGISTAYMLRAARLNQEEGRPPSQITCVEPHPTAAFRRLQNILRIEQPCQTVPYSVFAQLQPGDLLFIDSSHSVKVGSDVVRIYLEMIRRLPPGVFIHIHDIFLPYIYPRSVLLLPFGCSQETALLLALLTNNQHLSVLACLPCIMTAQRNWPVS